jgi:hypothetical protein
MLPEPDHHPATGWRGRVLAGIATLSLASSLVLIAPSAAQDDGTGGAPPLEETSCVLVPASDIEDLMAGNDLAAATPVASPVAATPVTGASPVAATPVTAASPGASPVAEAAPSFDAELLTEDLTATSTSLASCLSEGRFLDAAERTAPVFRGQLVGNGRPLPAEAFASIAATFPETTYQVVEIGNATLVDESTATADIVWQVGHQVRVDRWTFTLERVQGLEVWVVARAEPGTLEPAREAAVIDVTITNSQYALNPARIEGDAVEFRVNNQDGIDHELLVLRLAEGVTTETLLTTPGPELPEGVTFIGQATVPAASNGRLLLADLEPGTYTIVCLLPGESGVPHLAEGMEATFEVAPGS